jgi:hypothetical protein
LEDYICALDGKFRSVWLKFRAGVSWVGKHRSLTFQAVDSLCPFCPGRDVTNSTILQTSSYLAWSAFSRDT